jgi:site-specific recombinase XerC
VNFWGLHSLTHETITKAVNLVTRTVSEEISNKPNITSHSFRVGYITHLWKDSKDIEFVKQTIGHRNLRYYFGLRQEII